jgi:AcrR family transcriptional regulator
MRLSSQNASPQPRLPQRERGRARVASLLAAAATAFADKGYEGATMTEIAARAGASIGSLYQFFPTKELLADALVRHYAEALDERLAAVEATAAQGSTDELGRRLFPLLIEFRADHPAFAVLAEASGARAVRGGEIRAALRRRLTSILRHRAPELGGDRLEALAVAVLQIMKAAVALNAESQLAARTAALDHLSRMLRHHLELHLGVAATTPSAL